MKAALNMDPNSGYSDCFSSPVLEGVKVLKETFNLKHVSAL